MEYRATIRLPNGRIGKMRVHSPDRRKAARELSLSPARVLKVDPDWLGSFMRKEVSGGPPRAEQAILLENIAAQLGTKSSVEQVFTRYLEHDKRFVLDQAKQARAYEIEDYLEALNFDKNVVLLAKAGRESGAPAEALREAAQYLQDEEDQKNAVSKQLGSGFLYGGLALVAVIAGPIGFGAQLTEIESKLRMELKYNAATHMMRALEGFYEQFWLPSLIVLITALLYRRVIFDHCHNLPLLSLIDRLQKVKRGINFLSAFVLLQKGNKTPVQALEIIQHDSPSRDKPIYEQMLAALRKGDSLSSAMEAKHWSASVLSGTAQFGAVSVTDVIRMGEAILRGQKRELTQVAVRLATIIQAIGMAALVVMLVICVAGFLLPIMSGGYGGMR